MLELLEERRQGHSKLEHLAKACVPKIGVLVVHLPMHTRFYSDTLVEL